jgi:hypothetical protein
VLARPFFLSKKEKGWFVRFCSNVALVTISDIAQSLFLLFKKTAPARKEISLPGNLFDAKTAERLVASCYIKSQAAWRKPNYWDDTLRDPTIDGSNTYLIARSNVAFSVQWR